MIRGGHDNEIVLLTAQETITFAEIVQFINETTGRDVRLQFVAPEEYVRLSAQNDHGEKPEEFFPAVLSWYAGITKGDAATTHPLMAELLGRKPTGASEFIRRMLGKDRDYTWHQNYASK